MESPGCIIDLGPSWHYRLETPIARSTFGVVWRAIWQQTSEPVAVKTVRHERMAAAAPDLRGLWPAGLRREIDCLGRIRHRHIVSCLHHGAHDGLPVLVLARLRESLETHVVAAGGRLPIAESLEIVCQVAAGLADLHRFGLRHLDLKPANLLLAPSPDANPQLRIADFGTALGLNPDEAPRCEHGFRGTRGWLAPEQAIPCRAGELEDGRAPYRTDSRTDVYGLGLLLFHLLTGVRTEFSATVLDVLRVDPREAWIQHDVLGELAAAGLSEADKAALAGAISSASIEVAFADGTAGQTWVPGGSGDPPEASRPSTAIQAVVDLLAHLLAGRPDERPANGAAALDAIVRTQNAYAVSAWPDSRQRM